MRSRAGVLLVLACSLVAFGQVPQTMNSGHIFVVRHAEKQSERADALSTEGKARAACLAETLKDAQISAVIISPFNRTQQTAEPTADEFKVKIERLKADDYPAIAEKAKQAAQSGNVLIVGHSNTVPQIVKAVSNVDVSVGDSEYDRLFVLDRVGVTQLHYCPSKAPEPESKMK